MATKSQEILLKGNTTNASAVPSSLKVREIAINALDRSLFTNDGNSIVKLYTGTTKWFDVNGNANNALKADSVAWAGISGKPTTFTPSAHTHTASDVSGLPTSLKNPYALTFGSKTYDGSAAATITASDLGALTAHQSIYALTLQVNGTSKGVYNPASAAKTINIAVPTKTSDITNNSGFITSAAIPTALKNPYAVEIKANGVSLGTYDGSATATFNLSAANVGAANKVHTHTASEISGLPTNLSAFTNDVGFITGITKSMVEGVLTGDITSHTNSYIPLSDKGLSNGQVPYYVTFPSYEQLVKLGYNEESTQNDDEYYLKGLCKWAIDNYANQGYLLLIGMARPSSIGYCHIQLYSSHGKDTNTGLPRYCSGMYCSLLQRTVYFVCDEYKWYWKCSFSGNAETASKWATPRTITLTGSVTGSVSLNGSANVSLATTTNHTHTFASLTSKPTTISGYGITDAITTGNIGSQSVNYATSAGNADTLDGKHNGELTAQYFSSGTMLTHNDTINRVLSGIYSYVNADNPTGSIGNNCILVAFRNRGRTDNLQIVGTANDRTLYYRIASNIGSPEYEKWTAWRELIHSDNYNKYAPTLTGTGASGTWGISISGNAATADVIATTYKNQSINFASNESKIRLISSYSGDALANGFPTQYVGGISAISSYVGWQMVTYGSSAIPNPYFRMVYETGDYSDWKKLAFLTDNVASATKLQTARTIFGQSFDGTAKVSGTVSDIRRVIIGTDLGDWDSNRAELELITTSNNANDFWLGTNSQRDWCLSGRASADGNALHLYNRTLDRVATINQNGNILIGTTTDAGYKFAVNSSALVNTVRTQELRLGKANPDIAITQSKWYYATIGYEYEDDSPRTLKPAIIFKSMYDTYSEGSGNELMRIRANGNILIGTTTDNGYKLQVNGSERVYGDLIVDGEVSALVA